MSLACGPVGRRFLEESQVPTTPTHEVIAGHQVEELAEVVKKAGSFRMAYVQYMPLEAKEALAEVGLHQSGTFCAAFGKNDPSEPMDIAQRFIGKDDQGMIDYFTEVFAGLLSLAD